MSMPARRSSGKAVSTCCRPTISTMPHRKSSRLSREGKAMPEDHLAAPKPLEEHRRLAVFAGEWSGEEVVFPSRWNTGGPAISHVVARVDLNGFYLIQDTRQTRDGKESFATHGVFTYDREDRHYKLFWHVSLGYFPPDPARRRLEQKDVGSRARFAARQCAPCLRGRRRQQLHHENPVFA